MSKEIMIGVAKNVFQLHAASMTGQPLFRKKLSRHNFPKFTASQAPAVIVMEACGSAHHRAREMISFGHEVKLIAPHYVKPFVKRQKNDAADAEAIVIAAQRPEIRFVEPKSVEQRSKVFSFRARERLVHQRTELINALRPAFTNMVMPLRKGYAKSGRSKRYCAIRTATYLICCGRNVWICLNRLPKRRSASTAALRKSKLCRLTMTRRGGCRKCQGLDQ